MPKDDIKFHDARIITEYSDQFLKLVFHAAGNRY
jgi:hypothetical protein